MPTFAYSGRTRGGQNVNGERAADNMDAAVAALRRDQILVTRIAASKDKAEAGDKKKGRLGKKVSARHVAEVLAGIDEPAIGERSDARKSGHRFSVRRRETMT